MTDNELSKALPNIGHGGYRRRLFDAVTQQAMQSGMAHDAAETAAVKTLGTL